MDNKIEQLAKILRESENIVFFGGAGMSTESGIPDFRSADGLYNEKLKINFTSYAHVLSIACFLIF